MKISKLCFGCEPLGGTDWGEVKIDKIKSSIYRALDLGVNFFDTAGVYGLGLSEERLSNVLGGERFNVIIATKGGFKWNKRKSNRADVGIDASPKNIINGIENSLKRLKLETIPIYYVHWPDKKNSIEETFSTLENARKKGLILNIGCSNFNLKELREAKQFSEINFLQIPLNIIDPTPHEILNYCDTNKISVVPYNVLASGLLTGKYNKNTKFKSNDRRSRDKRFKDIIFQDLLNRIEELKKKAKENNLSLIQYSIKETLSNKSVKSVITGIKDINQLEENFIATNL